MVSRKIEIKRERKKKKKGKSFKDSNSRTVL